MLRDGDQRGLRQAVVGPVDGGLRLCRSRSGAGRDGPEPLVWRGWGRVTGERTPRRAPSWQEPSWRAPSWQGLSWPLPSSPGSAWPPWRASSLRRRRRCGLGTLVRKTLLVGHMTVPAVGPKAPGLPGPAMRLPPMLTRHRRRAAASVQRDRHQRQLGCRPDERTARADSVAARGRQPPGAVGQATVSRTAVGTATLASRIRPYPVVYRSCTEPTVTSAAAHRPPGRPRCTTSPAGRTPVARAPTAHERPRLSPAPPGCRTIVPRPARARRPRRRPAGCRTGVP